MERQRVLLVAPAELRAELHRHLAQQFDVRDEPDDEEGWQALLLDPSIRAVVGSAALQQRARASKITRIRELPMVAANGADDIDTELADDADGGPTLPARLGRLLREPPAPPTPSSLSSSPEPLRPSPRPKEPAMSRLDSLNKVLRTLQSESPGIEASALISEDGLMIASALPQDLEETRIGGMSATLLNLGTRAATELKRGDVREVIVRGELGCAVMLSAGRGTVLLVLATHATPLGLIFFDMREALKAIGNIL